MQVAPTLIAQRLEFNDVLAVNGPSIAERFVFTKMRTCFDHEIMLENISNVTI